jgi:hypothetical protein
MSYLGPSCSLNISVTISFQLQFSANGMNVNALTGLMLTRLMLMWLNVNAPLDVEAPLI